MPHRSTSRLKIVRCKKQLSESMIQPKLVLPQRNYDADADPLMQQYVKIGDTALRNAPSDLGEEDAA